MSASAIVTVGPAIFAALIALVVMFGALAIRPGRPSTDKQRLEAYAGQRPARDQDLQTTGLLRRLVVPPFRRFVRWLARRLPVARVEDARQKLVQAGNPYNLSAIDFMGLRVLMGIVLGALGFAVSARTRTLSNGLLMGLVLAGLGYLLPSLWLGSKIRQRRKEITRRLPDALDMLTISVEAGLAFESAMLRVAERWDNALTRELRRTVLEMRVGTPRDQALQRLTTRADVPELRTFVAVLIQSAQLGVSIADVLHSQAALIREKRRQRIEQLAHEASIKMLFPLVFLVFPALFVFILGPSIPRILQTLGAASGG